MSFACLCLCLIQICLNSPFLFCQCLCPKCPLCLFVLLSSRLHRKRFASQLTDPHKSSALPKQPASLYIQMYTMYTLCTLCHYIHPWLYITIALSLPLSLSLSYSLSCMCFVIVKNLTKILFLFNRSKNQFLSHHKLLVLTDFDQNVDPPSPIYT